MLGVISTHEPIRGEFAKRVREMLSQDRRKESVQPRKQSKWTIEREF